MEVFVTAVVAWAIAQWIKLIYFYLKNKKLDLSLLIVSGGMPSSHTAFVVAATIKVAILEGIYSSLFGACVVFSLVVMNDAIGVRQSVGIQARTLNEITKQLRNIITADIEKIKEVYGHNLFQVIAGLILGVLVGVVV